MHARTHIGPERENQRLMNHPPAADYPEDRTLARGPSQVDLAAVAAGDGVVLHMDSVIKRFRSGPRWAEAIRDLNLVLQRGRVTGLIGPDGAGKTTLMRLAAGLLRPDAGRITLFGMDVAREAQAAQVDLGYMPQRFGLYEDLTVQENLDLYADLHGVPHQVRPDRFRELMRMTGMAPFTGRLAGQLSGGMKQKLGLACTLIHPPRLMLLDEPTVGVDPVSRRELWQIVDRYVREEQATVLVSTAYLDEAERCDEVVVLHEGVVLGQGPPADFSDRLRGRTFHVRVPGRKNREVQEALSGREGVVDAIIQGDAVRVVLATVSPPSSGGERDSPAQTDPVQTNLGRFLGVDGDGLMVTEVPPRFEDAFVEELGKRSSMTGPTLGLEDPLREKPDGGKPGDGAGAGDTVSKDVHGLPPSASAEPGAADETVTVDGDSLPPPSTATSPAGPRPTPPPRPSRSPRPETNLGQFSQTPGGAVTPEGDRDVGSEAVEPEAVVEVQGVERRFGSFQAVKGVTFEVRRGEIFGLLGANGAGKTTTFRMLCGLLPASGGRLRVAGVDVRRAAAKARMHIGYMSQKFSLYGNLTVAQNLRFFARAYGLQGRRRQERMTWASRTFGLDPVASRISGSLPLGFKQRLALGCALMHEPAILFLDEPTSGVDPLARREFWHHINALAAHGVTVLVTTHFMEEAEYCDRLAIMARGEVLALGLPTEIKQQARTQTRPDPSIEDAFIALIESREDVPVGEDGE